MNIEIQKPELVERFQAHIQNGHFHGSDDLIEKALDALDEKSTAAQPSAEDRRRAGGKKSLVEVFAPLRGMNLDFNRNKSTGRPADFS